MKKLKVITRVLQKIPVPILHTLRLPACFGAPYPRRWGHRGISKKFWMPQSHDILYLITYAKAQDHYTRPSKDIDAYSAHPASPSLLWCLISTCMGAHGAKQKFLNVAEPRYTLFDHICKSSRSLHASFKKYRCLFCTPCVSQLALVPHIHVHGGTWK